MTSFPFVPAPLDYSVDWISIENELHEIIEPMRQTEQSPVWHGEGNVWNHTKMVCEELVRIEDWQILDEKDRMVLFLAALFHDVGKPLCTKSENGQIVSPNHAIKGAALIRHFLWRHYAFAGTDETMALRERIVSFVRLHSLPYQLLDKPEPRRDIVRSSQLVSNTQLAILSTADNLGRIYEQKEKSLAKIQFFKQFAEENNCLTKTYSFASNRSRFAYFNETLTHPTEIMYDDTWGEIILMSGLPASGKDYFIERNFRDRPVISLDAMRKKLGVDWTDDQSSVIQASKEQAKEYLRKQTPFVWNATNLSAKIRGSLIRLFTSYGAKVRIVYVETDLATLFARNKKRQHPVAESAIAAMLEKLEFPTIWEADDVEYIANPERI